MSCAPYAPGFQVFRWCVLGLTVLAAGAGSASAGSVVLGTSGWEANWAPSLDPFVNIVLVGETANIITIRKEAEFTQPPNQFDLFNTIPIGFQQTGASTITSIVIEEESILNSTGVAWTDFHFDLVGGPVIDPVSVFRNDKSFSFDTSPLDNQMFSPDDRSLWIDGFGLGDGGSDAKILPGGLWQPGSGVGGGELIIDVISQAQAPFTSFELKETPSPEPATFGLLALGGLTLLGRRRLRQ